MSYLEILAILENLRLRHPENDHILRVATACVAVCFGYRSRADWSSQLSQLGLVDYSDPGTAAEINYKRLLDKADAILAESSEV